MNRARWGWLVLAGCGGDSTTATPGTAVAATCVSFTQAPTIVSAPGGPGALDPLIAAAPEGGWFLGWRSEVGGALEVRRLDPTLRTVGPDPEPLSPSTAGLATMGGNGAGALFAWQEGPLLRAWRRDGALGPAAPPTAWYPREGEPPVAGTSAATTVDTPVVLLWRGARAKAPYALWNVEGRDGVPATLPGLDGATATGPGALAADATTLVAAWSQASGPSGWSIRTARLGASEATDLVAIDGAPTWIDAGLGDAIVVAWSTPAGAKVQRAGLGGAPIGDTLELGNAARPAVAVAGAREVVAWNDGDLRLQRLDQPGCHVAAPSTDVPHAGDAEVALSGDGKGVVAWVAPGLDGRAAVWARPFELVDPATAAAGAGR